MGETAATHVVNNSDANRFEILVDGQLAGYTTYHRNHARIVFIHTEIDERHRGRGLASALARHVVEDATARDLTIVPVCPVVAGWLRKHPDAPANVDWDAATALTAEAKKTDTAG
ncbi:putative GNAT family acetyltransferase [Catenulispora sp. GP43]|uniref:GNAT family N-acetyltransferase n=1 Tax=Catenulispora sp. GP43 TaxID=3156263 RepID=UPI0035188C87